ncbi:MAG: lipopolysaccharide biosynthesis protein [Aureliella sp.]
MQRQNSIAEGIRRIRCLLWRNSVPVTVFVSLAVFGLQAIHSILLARLLGPTGRGEYGTAMFFAQTMTYIGLLGTHYSIARHAADESSANSHSFRLIQRAAFRVGLVTGGISTLVAVMLSLVALPEDKSYLLPFCIICSLLLPAEHLRLTAQSVDHGRGKFNRYNLSRLFAATIFPCLVMFFFVAQWKSLQVIAWSTVAVSLVSYLFYWLISDAKGVFGDSDPPARRLIQEGLPDGGLVLANDAYDRFAVYIVIWTTSLLDQGLFLTALPISTLLLVAPNAFELFAFRAAVSKEAPRNLQGFVAKSLLIIAVQAVVLGALQLFLEPIVLLLYGEPFRDAIPVTRLLIIAMAFAGLTIVGEGYLRGRKRVRAGIVTRVVATIVMFGLAFAIQVGSPIENIAMAVAGGHAFNAITVGILVFQEVRHASSGKEVTQ